MSIQPNKRYSLEEYFELERNSPEKYQYLDGAIFPIGEPPPHRAISDSKSAHRLIVVNVQTGLQRCLNDRTVVYDVEAPIRLANGGTLNPDVAVGLISDGTGEEANYSTSPAIIVEVLSDATEAYDRGKKFEHYQSIPSFQEYVLVAQDRPHIDHFVRQPDGSWRLTMMDGLESTLQLSTVDAELPFRAIFDGISFPPQAAPVTES